MTDLSAPNLVLARLAEIENDLAIRQNAYEQAASNHFRAKRDKEQRRAVEFMSAEGSVEARKAQADRATATIGMEAEAEFEALRAVVKVLDVRATIGMAILKAQGRS